MAKPRKVRGVTCTSPDGRSKENSTSIPTTILGDSELEGEIPDDPMVSKPIHPFILPISQETQLLPVWSYPSDYEDLADVFKEDGTDCLPPHRTVACAVELIPGVPLPKPR
ncbi:hypothetical protein E2320_014904, partial [Naja naja]